MKVTRPKVTRPKVTRPKVTRPKVTRERSTHERERARLAKQREQALLAKQREQALLAKQREQARLAKQREQARLAKQREQSRLAKQREQSRLTKQRELERARETKEREAQRQALEQAREQQRVAKAAEREAAKLALQQAREQQLAEKTKEREAAKLAREEERQRAQVERERQREEARRAKEEERSRKEGEREAYRKAKEAERERLRAEKEAARRALEGKVARATKRAHRADGLLGRSSTARLYRADAIPDQSGTTRRTAEAEPPSYAKFANLRPPVAPMPPSASAVGAPTGDERTETPEKLDAVERPAGPEPAPSALRSESVGPESVGPESVARVVQPAPLEEPLEALGLGESADEATAGEGGAETTLLPDFGEMEDMGEIGAAPVEGSEAEEVSDGGAASEGATPGTAAGPTPMPKFDLSTVEDRQASIEERLASTDEEFRRNYMESLDMSWIYHDSALEGVVYTFQELKTAIDPNITVVPDSSLQPVCEEIRRHKAALDLVRELAQKRKELITVDTVKRIYLTLHPEEGDLKSVKYRKDIPQHRLYFHEYAAPDKIAYKVRQIVDWLSGPEPKKIKNPVRIAGRVHYDLLRVFPFPTDSGKVARLVMNLVLLRSGYPPAIIHSTERQRYYEALKGTLPVILSMVNEAIQNGLQSIEKILDEQETRMRSFVS